MRRRFRVDSHDVRAGLDKRRNVPVRVRNHEMDMERHFSHIPDRLDDQRTNRDVRHEVAVHDIDMQQMRAGFFNPANVFAERREISGKYRGSDANAHWLTSRRITSDLVRRYPAWGFC